MADSLYPVFEIPTLRPISTDEEQTFKPAPYFDFEKGDFVRDGANRVLIADGYEAYKTWVLKVLKTQQRACLSYMGTGIDQESSMAEPSREAVQTAFERTITDALLVNASTERVYDFDFTWNANVLNISFVVKPKAWAAFDVYLEVV